MSKLTFNDIITNINNGNYDNNLTYQTKSDNMIDGYITDKSMSVQWNIDQVEINKQNYKESKEQYRQRSIELANKLQEDVINVIMNYTKLNKDSSMIIFNYAYDQDHSYGNNAVINTVSDLCDMILDIMQSEKGAN